MEGVNQSAAAAATARQQRSNTENRPPPRRLQYNAQENTPPGANYKKNLTFSTSERVQTPSDASTKEHLEDTFPKPLRLRRV